MNSSNHFNPERMNNSSSRLSLPVITLTIALVFGLAYITAGCEESPVQSDGRYTVEPEAAAQFGNAHLTGNITPAELNRKVAAVRKLTAPFHNIETAIEAGWSVELTPCLELPGEGGMGYHYGNPAFINDQWNILEPEALMYEPQKNGRMRLIGVEYIVPFDEYSEENDPPVLFGQEFHQNHEAGIWALHAWVWKHNPNGMFADWNPRVSCKFE